MVSLLLVSLNDCKNFLSRDEIVARLSDLQKKYPQAFVVDATYKDVTNEPRNGEQSVETNEESLALEHDSNKDGE